MGGPRATSEKQLVRAKRLTREEKELASRLTRARQQLRDQFGRPLSAHVFGEFFGCDEWLIYKLESGLVRIWSTRQLLLEVLERALATTRPEEVWGPVKLTPHQRLARVCRLGYPEAA